MGNGKNSDFEGIFGIFEEFRSHGYPVGQEWYVVLDGDIDGKNNDLAVRWIRSRNRARVQVLDIKELGDEYIEQCVDKLTTVSLNIQSREEIKRSLQEIVDKNNIKKKGE